MMYGMVYRQNRPMRIGTMTDQNNKASTTPTIAASTINEPSLLIALLKPPPMSGSPPRQTGSAAPYAHPYPKTTAIMPAITKTMNRMPSPLNSAPNIAVGPRPSPPAIIPAVPAPAISEPKAITKPIPMMIPATSKETRIGTASIQFFFSKSSLNVDMSSATASN